MYKKIVRREINKHLDKKIKIRLLIYLAISVVLLGVMIYEVILGLASLSVALLGIILGIFIGFVVARMFYLTWDHDMKQIVSQLDWFGGLILMFYVVFTIFRGNIVGYFVEASAVGGVSTSVAAGVMIGRVFGTRGRIVRLLKEQKIF